MSVIFIDCRKKIKALFKEENIMGCEIIWSVLMRLGMWEIMWKPKVIKENRKFIVLLWIGKKAIMLSHDLATNNV